MREQAIYRFQTTSGLVVRVRPLKPTDGPLLLDLFEHMSADSRYLRFNVPLPDPDPDWVLARAEKLAYVRPAEGKAWLALADLPDQPDAPVAGVRYHYLTLSCAELSLVVRDDLHSLGIGTELLKFAARQAYAEGLNYLVGVVQSMNRALWHSIRNLDVPLQRERDGALTLIKVDLRQAELFRWKPGEPPDLLIN